MSERSIRRANERRAARERRREALRRRRAGLATGAAIGATALFAPAAQAATFQVNSLADGPPDACDTTCTLRDAIAAANADATEDVITFASALSGTIVLTDGEIAINYGVELDGPGAGVITVSGNDSSRIFLTSGDTSISGLTLADGASGGAGGAIFSYGPLTVSDSVVTGSTSPGPGGGIYAEDSLSLQDSEITGNTSARGGGVGMEISEQFRKYSEPPFFKFTSTSPPLTVERTEVSGNMATGDGGGVSTAGELDVDDSTISGNDSDAAGGGIAQRGTDAPLTISDSEITGNVAVGGGGVHARSMTTKYQEGVARRIVDTTISGNDASYSGGGVYLSESNEADQTTISRSTISGNDAERVGGGIKLGGPPSSSGLGDTSGMNGAFLLSNSTVSGNTADSGAGVSLGGLDNDDPVGSGARELANSTVAANRADSDGGGIFLADYGGDSAELDLTSTVVGDNTAAGAPEDLDRADASTTGGFDLAFTLVEAPGDAPLFQSVSDPNIIGLDPKLGALGANGGGTQTHLPAADSPLIDRGDAPARMETDQRGQPRTHDGAAENAPGGDGTDIGSVERGPEPGVAGTDQPTTEADPPPPTQTRVLTRVPPGGIAVRVRPRRDGRLPFRFRTRGAIIPPGAMPAGEACGSLGFVSVQVKIRGTTISTRRAQVRPDCTFSSRVTFTVPRRFGKLRRTVKTMLKFTVRFSGNERLEPATAKPRFVRVN